MDSLSIYSALKDTSGEFNVVGDYSGSPKEFLFENTQKHYDAYIRRLIITIQDFGAFDSGKYGNDIDLVNGLTLKVIDEQDQVLSEITRFPIITFNDWAMHCYDYTDPDAVNNNNLATVITRWTLGNTGIPQKIKKGWKLVLTANDDFTGLVKHYFFIDGYYSNIGFRLNIPWTW